MADRRRSEMMPAAIATAIAPQGSLFLLAQLAMAETGAEGVTLFLRGDDAALSPLLAHGQTIPGITPPADVPLTVHAFPIRVEATVRAVLAFALDKASQADAETEKLLRIAHAFEKVWMALTSGTAHIATAEVIARIEGEIMESKLASRVRGLLEGDGGTNGAGQARLEVMARHIDSVLRPSPACKLLEDLRREFEQELEERQWAAEAKAILQRTQGMSENQAYEYLRTRSRKTRKRVKDVARDVIEQDRVAGKRSA
jgi:hypothetical protein